MRYQGASYISTGWNMIDMAQLVVFSSLLYMRMNNVDSTSLFYPELKLVNIILAFFKTLFFIRIYKKFSLLVQMIKSCIVAVVPFAIYYIVFLLLFSTCFVILQMEIDAEVAEAEGLGYFEKTVL